MTSHSLQKNIFFPTKFPVNTVCGDNVFVLCLLAGPRGLFSWDEYLAKTDSVAAPWSYFRQVRMKVF